MKFLNLVVSLKIVIKAKAKPLKEKGVIRCPIMQGGLSRCTATYFTRKNTTNGFPLKNQHRSNTYQCIFVGEQYEGNYTEMFRM